MTATVTVGQMLKGKVLQGIVSVTPGTSVFDALAKMKENGIGIIGVMHESCLLGLFSHKDNSNKVTLENLDPKKTKVEDVMTVFSEVHWVGMEADVLDCILIMNDLGVNHLPVMDGEGEYAKPLGMISNKDIEREVIGRKLLKEMEEESVRNNAR